MYPILCRIVALNGFFVLVQQHSLFADVGFRSNDVNVTKVASFFSSLQKLISTLKSKHEWRFPLKVLILYYWKSGFYLNCTCSLLSQNFFSTWDFRMFFTTFCTYISILWQWKNFGSMRNLKSFIFWQNIIFVLEQNSFSWFLLRLLNVDHVHWFYGSICKSGHFRTFHIILRLLINWS